MSENADQIVLEYLSRANDVAHRHLGSRERLDFVTRLRQRIEQYRAEAGGATEPEQVRKVLARFGDPEALVRRERHRLDGADAAASADAGGAAPRARRAGRDADRPTARRARPAVPSDPGGTPDLSSTSLSRASRSAGASLSAGRAEAAAPFRPGRSAWPLGPIRLRLSRLLSPGGAVRRTRPAGRPGPAAEPIERIRPVPPSNAGAVDLDVLFRHRPVEVGAIALTAIGGLLLPVPLWIFGAAAGALSRLWTPQEKMIGLIVPALVTMAGTAALGGAAALAALGAGDMPPPLRLAGPLGAGYLGWRLLRSVGARKVRVTRARARRR
jgi:hypothetical protein